MNYQEEKLIEFKQLLEQHALQEGLHDTILDNLLTVRASCPLRKSPSVYEPAIIIVGQGKKCCYLDNQIYDYSVGNFLTIFLPMPIEFEITEASPAAPFLAACVRIDLGRIANLLLKMDKMHPAPLALESKNSSGIFTAPLNDDILDPVIRLLKCLRSPRDAAILGETIVDEIYYRVLGSEKGEEIKSLLLHKGEIQRISKAVEYIHQHLNEVISVEKLASLANMSSSGFYKVFKDVMHTSPIQYTKALKLFKAQTLIQEGRNVNEAGYLMGYNSPAQFSREYKRYFGFNPSLRVPMAESPLPESIAAELQ